MNNLKKLYGFTQNVQNIAQSLLFTSYDESVRTALTGDEAEDKVDLIDYFNSYIDKQGVQILSAFTDVQLTDSTVAIIEDIFEEGVLIRYLNPQEDLQSPHAQQNSTLKASSIQNGSTKDSSTKDSKATKAKTKKPTILDLTNNPDSKAVFVPFRTQKARPVQRLYLLGAEAQIKQGIFDDIVSMILPSSEDKHDFTVTDTKFISKNMIRIYISSKSALVQDDPGYAYRFELNHSDIDRINTSKKLDYKKFSAQMVNVPIQLWQYLQPVLENSTHATTAVDTVKKYGLLSALEVYKRLPEPQNSHKAQPIAATVEKRYYTLRQLKRNTDKFSGEVDIYIHDDTPGSLWAKSLQIGDKIKVDTHYQETIKEMTLGQPLFICDETSMPTVAAMLERWELDVIPIVISITNDEADFAYFDDMTLSDTLKGKLQIHYVNTQEVDNLADRVIEIIKAQNKAIDCAWGAIGKADFRPIKQYLRAEHGLKGKHNRVRAYWV